MRCPLFALRLVFRIDRPVPSHRVTDGQFSVLIIDRIPFQTENFFPAQTVVNADEGDRLEEWIMFIEKTEHFPDFVFCQEQHFL